MFTNVEIKLFDDCRIQKCATRASKTYQINSSNVEHHPRSQGLQQGSKEGNGEWMVINMYKVIINRKIMGK